MYTFICIISPLLLAVFPLLRSNEQPKWKTIMTHFKALKLFAMKINTKAWRKHIFLLLCQSCPSSIQATRVPSKTLCWKNFIFFSVFICSHKIFFFCSGLDFNAIRVMMMITMVMITIAMMMMMKKKQHCEGFNRLMWFLFEVFSKGVVKLAFELLLAIPVESLYHIYLPKHVWHDADTYM